VEKLCAGIDQALAGIAERFPGDDWTVVSCLAEGADRLIVARALAYRPAAHLVVPLPLPVEDYLTDFASDASRREFSRLLGQASDVIHMPGAASREEAYWTAGEYILEHANVLIALWDGQDAQGRGGTGEIVAVARQRGLPLAWVHAGNRKPGTQIPTSLGEVQGRIRWERFDRLACESWHEVI